ncbi:MAG TPA: ADP-ribosylglycohydrolase family protein [Candidatus Methanoperedens sp.]
MKHVEKLRNKYTGCILGAAIGDALGKQNEGLNRKDILEKGYITDYGIAPEGCPGEKLKGGQYTDDTEQMLVLSESLIECNGLSVSDFSKRICRWGRDIMNDPARKSLLGPSSAASIARLNSGMSWEYSGSDIPSCGSAMRVAPIGLFYEDMADVEFKAAMSSVPTHNSKDAIAGAVAVAVAVRCALIDMECTDMIKETSARTSNYNVEFAKKIELSFERKDKDPNKVFPELGTSYLVYETVPSAFYCFSKYFEEPKHAMTEAVNAGGDTDSIACITGALCGALHGVDGFPDRWISGLENKNMLEHVADMIFGCRFRDIK